MTTTILTPEANQTPAVVKVVKELSGAIWVARFRGSVSTADLSESFRNEVDAFLAAITAAGGRYDIANTFRPKQRAYMMHWSHRIYRNGFNPAKVPAMPGVEIEWVHDKLAQSVAAAKEMVLGFQIQKLDAAVPPALDSLHSSGDAIDLSISWEGHLEIRNKDETLETIKSRPRSGMNHQLKKVGLSYGVKKFVGGTTDKPHWSTTGH